MKWNKVRYWSLDTDRFGTITIEAENKEEAKKIARRFHGYKNLRSVRTYRHCELCDSSPCVCK